MHFCCDLLHLYIYKNKYIHLTVWQKITVPGVLRLWVWFEKGRNCDAKSQVFQIQVAIFFLLKIHERNHNNYDKGTFRNIISKFSVSCHTLRCHAFAEKPEVYKLLCIHTVEICNNIFSEGLGWGGGVGWSTLKYCRNSIWPFFFFKPRPNK